MNLLTVGGGLRLLRQPLMTIRRHFSKHLEGAADGAGHADGEACSFGRGSFIARDAGHVGDYTKCASGQDSIFQSGEIPRPAHTIHTPSSTKPGEITPGISQDEYRTRRNQLMTTMNKSVNDRDTNHLVIVLASSKKYMADEVPYPFRQNSDFLYLCGFQEPDSVLVLENIPGRNLPEHKSTLFVPKRDSKRELWDGPRAGTEGALEYIGVDEAYAVEDTLKEALQKYSLRGDLVVWYDFTKSASVHERNHSAVLNHLVIPCRSKGCTINGTDQVVHSLRVVKSPAECNLMHSSAAIASEAFAELMKFSRPGINESALYAKMDYECRIRGAEFLAYPPVIAGGNRANTLHYIANNQIIQGDEMVLTDAGCEFHGYASDITRTWPVSGKFTSAQAELYEAVLDVQLACIDKCHFGATLDQIYSYMVAELGKKLQRLGIVSNSLSSTELYQKVANGFCPHHLGHYLGMDVHDTGCLSRSNQLQPGMVITIEPGLYISETDTSVPSKYRGIGIRIEDNILITESEPENLSKQYPKHMEEIEAVMANV